MEVALPPLHKTQTLMPWLLPQVISSEQHPAQS